ncbi:MAG: hypothetical protein KFW21_02760 [Spirochaetota bacterium]|nr:hypothetical protein [Spirochaetota bacterium]
MKRIGLVLMILIGNTVSTNAAQNYSTGNLLLGIGVGAGTRSVYPIGAPQMTIHPSVELIMGSWHPGKIGIALGLTLDSSVNFFGGGLTGTLAPMLTVHYTLAPRFDFYTSLGMGLQLQPSHGTVGLYNVHVGFATGFNIVMTPAVIFNIGLAIHAEQFFGSAGVKVRFGDVTRIQYKKK